MRQLMFRRFEEKKERIWRGEMTAFLHQLKPQPPGGYAYQGRYGGKEMFTDGGERYFFAKAIYSPGEVIYIREAWAIDWDDDGNPRYVYKADGRKSHFDQWKVASYMPIEAARIFLEVTEGRIMRMGDVPKELAKELGATGRDWREQLREIWSKERGKGRSDAGNDPDPWVQVVRFRRVERPEEAPGGINDRILQYGTSFNRYTIRLAATGELLAEGTAADCAKAMGFQNPHRIYTLLTQVSAGQNNKYTIQVSDTSGSARSVKGKKRGWLRGESEEP